MRVVTIYKDEQRQHTSVSCDLQGQSNKDKLRPNEALKSSRLHIEHANSDDKTTQMRTFQ